MVSLNKVIGKVTRLSPLQRGRSLKVTQGRIPRPYPSNFNTFSLTKSMLSILFDIQFKHNVNVVIYHCASPLLPPCTRTQQEP